MYEYTQKGVFHAFEIYTWQMVQKWVDFQSSKLEKVSELKNCTSDGLGGGQNIDHMEDVPPSSGSIYRVFCIQRD